MCYILLVGFFPTHGIYYIRNDSLTKIVIGAEQNGILALSRDFLHFIVNYEASTIRHNFFDNVNECD